MFQRRLKKPKKIKTISTKFFSSSLTTGCAVRITGQIVPSPGREQDKELLCNPEQIHILGMCDSQVRAHTHNHSYLSIYREKGRGLYLEDPSIYPIGLSITKETPFYGISAPMDALETPI
jgi:aspartyl/asparaginyl-tRNA synthetase